MIRVAIFTFFIMLITDRIVAGLVANHMGVLN